MPDPLPAPPTPALADRLRPTAVWLMVVAVLWLLAGWLFPELWRPAVAAQRPLALGLFGTGALLMWRHTRRLAERQHKESLALLTHSSLTAYEFAPETLPMDEPPSPAQTQALLDETYPTLVTSPVAAHAAAPTPAPDLIDITAAAPAAWSPGLLRALEWRRFEALCEEIFKQDGYVTKPAPQSTDSAGYLWLHSRLDLQQPVRIVQGRNWGAEAIGVTAVREFLGAMVDAGLKSGALMTCGAFTPEAEALARRHGITLVNGPELLALINKRPEALQRELLAVATEGDYRRPTCRRCGLKMVGRSTHEDGLVHWACSNAPQCQGTLDWRGGPA